MKTAIIIPTYNEKDNIELLVSKISESLVNIDYSIIFVDDNSTDGTVDIIEKLKKIFSNVILYKRDSKKGLASAYIEGINYAITLGYDCFIQMDADLSHNPIYLRQMMEDILDYDLVIGSRYVKGGDTPDWGITRKIISFGGSVYSRFILNCPIHDLTGGFNCWKKSIIEKIDLNSIISKGYCFQIEMKYKAFKNNAKIKEIPIIFKDRTKGSSKMSKEIFLEALINILKLRLGNGF